MHLNMEIRKRTDNGVILHGDHPRHRTSVQHSAKMQKQCHLTYKQRIQLMKPRQINNGTEQSKVGAWKQKDNSITRHDNPSCNHTPIAQQKQLRNQTKKNLDYFDVDQNRQATSLFIHNNSIDQTELLNDHQSDNLNPPKQSVQRKKNMGTKDKKIFFRNMCVLQKQRKEKKKKKNTKI